MTLAFALAAAFGSLTIAAIGRFSRGSLRRYARIASAVAALFLFAAGLPHLLLGHRPGSSAALGPGAFFAEHPALLVGAAVTVIALLLTRLSRSTA